MDRGARPHGSASRIIKPAPLPDAYVFVLTLFQVGEWGLYHSDPPYSGLRFDGWTGVLSGRGVGLVPLRSPLLRVDFGIFILLRIFLLLFMCECMMVKHDKPMANCYPTPLSCFIFYKYRLYGLIQMHSCCTVYSKTLGDIGCVSTVVHGTTLFIVCKSSATHLDAFYHSSA